MVLKYLSGQTHCELINYLFYAGTQDEQVSVVP